jgi:hypothetical protein
MPPAHERLEGFNAFLGAIAGALTLGMLIGLTLMLAGWRP